MNKNNKKQLKRNKWKIEKNEDVIVENKKAE